MANDSKRPVMTHEDIVALLPHRAPLLLVDRVVAVDYDAMEIEATKCVSGLDPVFAGHFPGNPVMPGVYLVEGLAQASALLCFSYFESKGIPYERRCLLTSIDEARFRKPTVPGDVLHYHVKYDRSRGHFAWFTGQAKVDGETVAEAKFSALLPTPLKR
ncbi:MAG: 3-hydroxyacyl-ACP dehydratase FabZ [Silvanigrellales bacterium]|jgi:3-hydroxyacyl-[acyl-carrier-protein] dehydratase|nr:3-hydroxyacyl-ACP dehydratase FabZ [Silvanigrellales bacterium]